MKATVYRCYDAEGNLLYIGLAANADKRIATHRATSPWFAATVRVETEDFATRAEAAAHERTLISALRPPFNRQHTGRTTPAPIPLSHKPNMLARKSICMTQDLIDAIQAQAEREGHRNFSAVIDTAAREYLARPCRTNQEEAA